jgi:hypothetical protein
MIFRLFLTSHDLWRFYVDFLDIIGPRMAQVFPGIPIVSQGGIGQSAVPVRVAMHQCP